MRLSRPSLLSSCPVGLRLLALSATTLLLAPVEALAQCVSLTTAGSPVTQNFDGLANAGTGAAWTDNSTIPGAYSTRTAYNAATGSGNTGALYSFGVAATNPLTDRALGGIASSGTGTFYWARCYTNNTGLAITSVDVAYNGEQWRNGGNVSLAAQIMAVEHQVANAGVITDADLPTTGWTGAPALNFTSPITSATAGALDGNAPANRAAISSTLAVAVAVGQEFWIRWVDVNDTGNDHGLAIDDLVITPQAAVVNAPVSPTCPATLTTTFGTVTSGAISATDSDGTVVSATITGITPADPGTISIMGFTAAGGVGGVANGTLSVSNLTPVGAYSATIQWANNDGSPQTAACVVGITVSAAPTPAFIHDVQGSGAATPMPGVNVSVEGIVTASFQASTQLRGFFLQEEDADADANPATSEGIFVFCGACSTAVSEGQRVQVIGSVSEFFNKTEITSSSVVVVSSGNPLPSASSIDLPVVGVIDDFYEPREGMRVSFVDSLAVSEYFEMARYGQVELFEGGRPRQFTEANPPSVPGLTAHNDNLNRRRVILDDDNNTQNSALPPTVADGVQAIYHPHQNGGLSVGTQGVDFFRGGDLVNGLTGVLDWSFAGFTGTDAWRIRPTLTAPATFTVANPRPATAPVVGGAIKAASMNLLNYFTTLDTTSSSSTGPCGPGGTLDCRGADSVTELNRQRERASIVICGLNADVVGLNELENTTASATITDLLGAVNTRCGGAHPYDSASTGGTLGTDAIRVQLIYRMGVLSPVGAPQVDLDPVHNRPPTAQTFDVVDATNPAFGQRFTVIANHFKSKGCPGTGADADTGDGQGCFNGTRTAQATQLLAWVNGTVLPAAGDPDVLLLGDFNSNAQEDPVTTITGGGYTDLESAFLGASAYSYVFDGQIGHLDYAFSNAALTPQITGVNAWHINADEIPLFDYNDEIKDTGESAFEEKPDGSALAPPRTVFQAASPYRASDHDPVLVGLFAVADLALTKVDTPDPVAAGANITYTITVTNNGPDAAASASMSDTLAAGTTFVSLSVPGGWSCTTPSVGSAGTVSCSIASLGVGNAVFTLVVNVGATVPPATVLSNTATAASSAADSNAANNSGTAVTTVTSSPANTLTVSDATRVEGNSGTAALNFTVTRTVTGGVPVTFTATTVPGTATGGGVDYINLTSSSFTMTAAQLTKTVSVSIVGEVLDENNEQFQLTLVPVTPTVTINGSAVSAAVNGNITDNDTATFTINDFSINEGPSGQMATWTVSQSVPSTRNTSVMFSVSGTATAADYGTFAPAVGTPLMFTASLTTPPPQAITVPIIDDTLDEFNETLVVNLNTPTGGAVLGAGGTQTGSVTIIDSPPDPQPVVTINSVSLAEGSPSGNTTFVFTLSLNIPSAKIINVTATTSDGTALISDNDYVAKTQGFTFTAGQLGPKNFSVTVKRDTATETDETFGVTLSGVTNATAGPAGVGTIVNDDSPPQLTIGDLSIAEGNLTGTTSFVFTVTRSSPLTGVVTFNIATNDVTATSTGPSPDYTAISMTGQTFAASETSKTYTVLVNKDSAPEGHDKFTLDITGADYDLSPNNPADVSALGTIENDDAVGLGDLVISEFRLRGPDCEGSDADDEFVEIANRTAFPIGVGEIGDTSASGGFSVGQNGTGKLFTIPNDTIIPARGHYLGANPGSGSCGSPALSPDDPTWEEVSPGVPVDAADNTGLALFATATAGNYGTATPLDAVGFTGDVSTQYIEGGTGLAPLAFAPFSDYSFVRRYFAGTGGGLQDGQPLVPLPPDSSLDWVLVNTAGSAPGVLGGPSPENTLSETEFTNAQLTMSSPEGNFVTVAGTPSAVEFYRLMTNNTGLDLNALRFKVSFLATSGTLVLNPVTSYTCNTGAGTLPLPPCVNTYLGLALEESPPNYQNQDVDPITTLFTSLGGLNSTLRLNSFTFPLLGALPNPPGTVYVNLRALYSGSGSFAYWLVPQAK